MAQFFRMTHRFGAETFYELLREPEQVGGDRQVDAKTNRGTWTCGETDLTSRDQQTYLAECGQMH